MSRKRDLSSDISHDERIAELSESEHGYLAVALYMMAIPQADDWGRLPGSPREFKMLVCPGFDTPKHEIDAVLSEIAAIGLWERYEVDGKKYIAFPPDAWFKRQTYINTSKRTSDAGSLYPPNQQFLEYSATQTAEKSAAAQHIGKEQQETARNSKKRLTPSPSPVLSEQTLVLPQTAGTQELPGLSEVQEPEKPEEAEKPQETEKPKDKPRPALLLRFDVWYDVYPKKRNPGDAERAWLKLKPDADQLAAMLAALEWQKRSRDWTKEGGQYIPLPASYLSNRAWLNEPDEPIPKPALTPATPRRILTP